MPVSWIDLAMRLLPVALAVIKEVLEIIEQMETEHRDEIDLEPVREQLAELREPVEKLAEKLNGDTVQV